MAWNESFSGEQGGGWGGAETSFATAGPKDTAASKTAERLAVPVTISDLVDSANGREIRSRRLPLQHGELRLLWAVSYLFSLWAMLRSMKPVRPLRAYTLEAKIAKIYFPNGVHDVLQRGEAALNGTCMGAPAPAGGAAGGASQNPYARQDNSSNFATQPQRMYNQNAPASSTSHGMSGQKGKIMELLDAERNNHGENGMSMDRVKVKLGAVNMNQLRLDLDFLVAEGHIYATINDDHFAMIS